MIHQIALTTIMKALVFIKIGKLEVTTKMITIKMVDMVAKKNIRCDFKTKE